MRAFGFEQFALQQHCLQPRYPTHVMAGLVPAIHAVRSLAAERVKLRLAPSPWMDGSSPSMTALGLGVIFKLSALQHYSLQHILRHLCSRATSSGACDS
jgi:hypothetical protein